MQYMWMEKFGIAFNKTTQFILNKAFLASFWVEVILKIDEVRDHL